MYLSTYLLLAVVLTLHQSGPSAPTKLCGEEAANVCSSIPEEMKVRLIERFNQYVELHRTNDREKMYDFTHERNMSKKEFLESQSNFEWSFPKMGAFEFQIYEVFETEAKVKGYSISLCIVNAKASKGTLYRSSAFLINQEWLFGSIVPMGFLEGAKPISCKLDRKQ